jgi:hypothetical protein
MMAMKNRTPVRARRQSSPLAWMPILFALVPLGVMVWAIPLTTASPFA